MKEYTYNKGKWCFAILLILATILFLYWFDPDFFHKNSLFHFLFIALFVPISLSPLKTKVTFDNEGIFFYSFFNSLYTPKVKRDFYVKYSDIISLELKKGVFTKKSSLEIKANGREDAIMVNYSMNNHKELFEYICENTRKVNANAHINDKVWEYLENK